MEEKAWDGKYNVSVAIVTDDWGCLGLAGPASRLILQKLTNTDLSDSAFPFLNARTIQVGSIGNVRALRISYTGMSIAVLRDGWCLAIPCQIELALRR